MTKPTYEQAVALCALGDRIFFRSRVSPEDPRFVCGVVSDVESLERVCAGREVDLYAFATIDELIEILLATANSITS